MQFIEKIFNIILSFFSAIFSKIYYMVFGEMPELLALALCGGFCFVAWHIHKLFTMRTMSNSTAHGSARFATKKEQKKQGIYKEEAEELGKGIVCGYANKTATGYKLYDEEKGIGFFQRGKYIEAQGHTFICAPSRSGKGIGPIVSTLLTYEGSIITYDPKAENLAITRRRREELGQEVYVLDPFQSKSQTHQYNPLEQINTDDPNCLLRSQQLVQLLAPPPDQQDPFFDKASQQFIEAVILFLCTEEGKRTQFPSSLVGVRDLLSLRDEEFMTYAEQMSAHKKPAIRNGGNAMLNAFNDGEDKKLFSNIMAGVNNYMNFLDNENIRHFFERTTCPLHRIFEEDMTVYFISTPATLKQCAPIARMLFLDTLDSIINKPMGGPKRPNTLFLLDEFPLLGKMEKIEEAVGIMAGIGATICIVSQSISQLSKIYTEDGMETFTNNMNTLWLGAAGKKTPEYISEMLGKATILTDSADKDGKISNTSLMGRDVLTADEIRAIGKDRPLLIPLHCRPVVMQQLAYFANEDLKDHADANPYI